LRKTGFWDKLFNLIIFNIQLKIFFFILPPFFNNN
jgi:hypothetical protein